MLIEKHLDISNIGSRKRIRERVVYEFLEEEPGSGSGDLSSKYRYHVETLEDGKRIVLTRPAYLNKGFDFVVRVEGINFNTKGARLRDNPNHPDIIEDLVRKRAENPKLYGELFGLIQKVHACEEVTRNDYSHLYFETGYATDLILLVVKWLFIEQDITYWNFSGRNMFMSKIPPPE